MSKKKQVLVRCHCRCAVDPQYETSWGDFWIVYHDQHRQEIYLGPMVAGLGDLLRQIEINEDRELKHHNQKYLEKLGQDLREFTPEITETELADVVQAVADMDIEAEILEWKKLHAEVLKNGFGIYHKQEPNDPCPDIFINCKWLNRKRVEQALSWYLHTHCKLTTELKFSWKKPSLFITSY